MWKIYLLLVLKTHTLALREKNLVRSVVFYGVKFERDAFSEELIFMIILYGIL